MSSLPALAAPLAAGLGSGKATAPGRDWPGAVFAARAAQPGAKCGFLPNLPACGPRQGWDGLNELGMVPKPWCTGPLSAACRLTHPLALPAVNRP